MNPDEKITSSQTDDNQSESSGDSTAELPVLSEQSLQAQNKLPDKELANIQSTAARSQDIQSKSSEIIHVSQELNLQAENQSRTNQPQSEVQCVVSNLQDAELRLIETHAPPEQNIQFGNQPPVSQSVPKLKSSGIQSEHVEIHVSPEKELKQQFEHSAAEKRVKEDRNIIQRDDDAIEELSGTLQSPTKSPTSEVKKEKVDDSCIVKYLKRRKKYVQGLWKRKICAGIYIIVIVFEGCLIGLYERILAAWSTDIYFSLVITIATCLAMSFLLDRGKLSFLNEKLDDVAASYCPCCKRHKAKPILKQSQHVHSGQPVANFQHEVVDVKNINPKDLPHASERPPESPRPVGHPPQTPLIVNVDVHKENTESPEHPAEGACGYSPIYASGACGYSPRSEEKDFHDP